MFKLLLLFFLHLKLLLWSLRIRWEMKKGINFCHVEMNYLKHIIN